VEFEKELIRREPLVENTFGLLPSGATEGCDGLIYPENS
jgi:hypothetical protein